MSGHAWTVEETGRRIAEGADPVEIAERTATDIESSSSPCFISTCFTRARQEAEACRQRQKEGRLLGPLDGVPVAWKDLIDVAGTVTTCASKTLANRPAAERDAACVAAAARAGMVSVGKTNLTEFAFSGLGLNLHYGTPANPHDPKTPRVPGGSSSGSAVAVASRLVPCAVGTDTGGSVRVPAAFNGIVGYKPSVGRVSTEGVAPLAETFDSVGPLCRTVADCALIDCAMRGAPPLTPEPMPAPSVELVVPENYVHENLDSAVGRNFERALERLASGGCHVTRCRFDTLDRYGEVFRDHGALTALEASRNWREILESPKAEAMDPRVRDRMLGGKSVEAREAAVRSRRREIVALYREELGSRFLLTPTVAHVAPEIEPLNADTEWYRRMNMRSLRITMAGNFLSACGVSMPTGTDGSGMPTALLLSASDGRDAELLSAAMTVERLLEVQISAP